MKLLPFIRAQIPQHGFTKQGICPGLIAPSLSPKPGNNIGIKAKSQLLFQRSVEGIADRVLPELLRQFRDVGCIDLAVWPPRELFQAALASGCQAAIRKTVLYDFRHLVCRLLLEKKKQYICRWNFAQNVDSENIISFNLYQHVVF